MIQPSSTVFLPPLSPLTDIEDSDYNLPTSSEAPSSFPSTSSSFLSFSKSDLIIINTNFNPNLKENLTPPYPRNPDFDRFPLTELQREFAANAVIASSIPDFSKKVR